MAGVREIGLTNSITSLFQCHETAQDNVMKRHEMPTNGPDRTGLESDGIQTCAADLAHHLGARVSNPAPIG